MGKAPREVRRELKPAILASFHADDYETGREIGRQVIARYRDRFPAAMQCMEENLEATLAVLKLPPAHHKRLRTANILERTFGEKKRRTKVIPHFFTEKAALKLSYATMLAVSNKWRGLTMDAFTAGRIEELRKDIFTESKKESSAA